ncbi:bone morphogenetic protein 2-like isoform X2 [Pleurodeles waltl]|uniref:bone morphogenetic protein 2-like isoform X2 n=1 Tax=Pleurodeles waltl TaxID=8319 RepID=UPI0037098736
MSASGSGMGTWLLCVWLVVCRPVLMLWVTLQDPRKESVKSSSESGVISEAIQMLHEVFSIGEMPPNTIPQRKPPQFMVDLFNAVADLDGITKGYGLQQGNVVRSFEDKVRAQDQSYFYFNISSAGKGERMLKAELRVFKLRQVSGSGRFHRHHFCRADVYELLDSRVKPWRGNLISSRLLPLHSQGWEVFNVTQVSRWLQDASSNYGFLIISTLPSGNSLDDHFMSFSRSTPRKGSRTSPFLVLFSDDGRRRASNPSPEPGFPPSPADLPPLLPNQNIDLKKIRQIRDLSMAAQHHHVSCQRVPLYVDFEEIGWEGWIISPRGYNAYHCRGACIFPLGQGLGATNHATVQSIAHALKLSKDIDTPCCVPDKLHSINLLYFDDEENVVLKQYDEMVAVSCGCH